jgi:spore coat protein H
MKQSRLLILLCISTLAAAITLLAEQPVAKPIVKPAPAVPRKPTTKEVLHTKEGREADAFFNNTKLSRITLEVEPAALQGLNDKPHEWVHATVKAIVPGQREVTIKNVAMHLKGSLGSFRKVEDKPAMNVNFDKFVDGQNFQGIDKMLLNNSVQDPSYLSENLCGELARACGSYAARASNAQVILNGRNLGPYVLKEGFHKPFFRKFFPDPDGNLYEGSFKDIDGGLPIHLGKKPKPPADANDEAAKKVYEAKLKKREDEARVRLNDLIDACRVADPVARREKLEQVLDIDKFLTFMAFESMAAHWDGYCGSRNNYRIYHDLKSDKLVFIAHGMDQMFQKADYPLMDNNNALVCKAVLGTLHGRQQYFDRVIELRKKWFTPEKLAGEVDRLSARIMPLMQEIGPNVAKDHAQQAAGLKQRVLQRLANIDQQLADAPRSLKFDGAGVASLDDRKWNAVQTNGEAAMDQVNEGGRPKLHLKFAAPGGDASWQSALSLPPGQYTLEGLMRTANVIPPDGATSTGPNDPKASAGAALLVIGGGDAPHQIGFSRYALVKRDFEVKSAEVDTIVSCSLTAKSGEAFFDLATLRIRKKPPGRGAK